METYMEYEIFLYGMRYLSYIYTEFSYFISVFYEALNYVHFALQQWLCKHHMHWLCVNVMIIWLIEKNFKHWISIYM